MVAAFGLIRPHSSCVVLFSKEEERNADHSNRCLRCSVFVWLCYIPCCFLSVRAYCIAYCTQRCLCNSLSLYFSRGSDIITVEVVFSPLREHQLSQRGYIESSCLHIFMSLTKMSLLFIIRESGMTSLLERNCR